MSALSRRHFMTAAAGLTAVAAAPRSVFAQAAPAPAATAPAATGPFVLPPLTYATNAFEPHIDARTM
jgi:Fe-Mn family superoxide dismutase